MARPQTALNAHGGLQKQVFQQHKTAHIYGAINEGRYSDAVNLLNKDLSRYPQSKAGLSILGHCYYYMQEFGAAANAYEQLVKQWPGMDDYRLYYAQSLYKAGLYEQALRACHTAEYCAQNASSFLRLQAIIKYELDDLTGCRALLENGLTLEPDSTIAYACLAYKENRFDESLKLLSEARNQVGFIPDIAYNMALCHYKSARYGQALQNIAEIIENGVHQHPELSVGANADGAQVRSVGNSQILKESMLIEAFNLKAAIEFQLSNMEGAREALTDMPPRQESELDAVSLHNHALIHMEQNANDGVRKLSYLLSRPSFPPETFGNLVLLYCKMQCYDLAADTLAQNAHLHESHLGAELFEYLQSVILVQSSPEEAYRKFDALSAKHTDNLRKLTKSIQDARIARDNDLIASSLAAYDTALEQFMPVLMSSARIYWDRGNYAQVEHIFKSSAEFCSEHAVWKLNVAHVFFMQADKKFKEAIRYYEPIVKEQAVTSVLDVTAMVLANLCVSYIMTSQNEVAQELMNQIEKEEERSSFGISDDSEASSSKQLYHLCIVNLVIGTLYCAKFNFRFGISRIMKSLEPFDKKLSPDTWYYAKRCLLALCENLAKQMMVFDDAFFNDVITFLDAIDKHGKNIKSRVSATEMSFKDHHSSFSDAMLPKSSGQSSSQSTMSSTATKAVHHAEQRSRIGSAAIKTTASSVPRTPVPSCVVLSVAAEARAIKAFCLHLRGQ